MEVPSYSWLLFAGVLVRVVLLAYGEWQDATMVVKYTDIDYVVFTDAARSTLHGASSAGYGEDGVDGWGLSLGLPTGSPYDRATYRYTPLLAWMLIPNIVIHKSSGKWLFVVCDVLVAVFIRSLLMPIPSSDEEGQKKEDMPASKVEKHNMLSKGFRDNLSHVLVCKMEEKFANKMVALWLFNPLTLTVSTRGNADVVVVFLVLWTLWLLRRGSYVKAGLVYGLCVHFKIYPIIYALALWLSLPPGGTVSGANSGAAVRHEKPTQRSLKRAGYGSFGSVDSHSVLHTSCSGFFSVSRVRFACASFAIFSALFVLCYRLYGENFMQNTYLYHVTRKDTRHNFSVYFYMLYLAGSASSSALEKVLLFLPQVALICTFSVLLARRYLYFCLFALTFMFVAFNKVCTAQYFIWYIGLLPLAMQALRGHVSPKRAVAWVSVWLLTEVHWLLWAYLLEFQGMNTFLGIWVAGLLFFAAHVLILNDMLGILMKKNRVGTSKSVKIA